MIFDKICVLGLGYIGLSIASMFAVHNAKVIGIDVDIRVIETFSRGDVHLQEPGLGEVVRQAMGSINLVILESASSPRTTIDLVKPILVTSDPKAGEDFLFAYSPEGVLLGYILHEIVENARVIGDIDPAFTMAGRDFYSISVHGDIMLTDATTVEMVKLMENTFRDVTLALANEFALVAQRTGVNVCEAIELANRHPRVKILKLGPGVGGHRIAVEDALEVTGPRHAFRIVVLGLAYKAKVDDYRENPAVEVAHKLIQGGFSVHLNDVTLGLQILPPHFDVPLKSIEDTMSGADRLLILTDHDACKQLQSAEIRTLMRRRLVIDTRNSLDLSNRVSHGFEVLLGKRDHEIGCSLA